MSTAKEEILNRIKANREKGVTGGSVNVTTGPAKKPFSFVPTHTVGKDQQMYSKLFMAPPPNFPDFPITIFKPEDWDAQVRDHIPTIDPDYILPKNETYWAAYAMEFNKRCIITGKSGTGKTALVRFISAVTKTNRLKYKIKKYTN